LNARPVPAGAFEADEVDANQLCAVTLCNAERWHVLRNHGTASDECVAPDLAELMDAREAADDDVIAEVDVSREADAIGNDDVTADAAIVGDVGVGHQQAMIVRIG
jgi:hypothetical protein